MAKLTKTIAMAMDRKQFKAKASEHLVGALGEYLKSRLAKTLGWPDGRYVGKWRRETETLLDRLDALVAAQPTTQKFDRAKAVRESLRECVKDPLSWLGVTVRVVARVAKEEGLPNKVAKSWGVGDLELWLEEFGEKVDLLL